MRKNGKDIKCPVCGTIKYRRLAHIKKNIVCCSRRCSDINKRGIVPSNIDYARSRSPIQKGNKLARANTGEKHWAWQGDKPSYRAVHDWLKKHFGNARKCEQCGSTKNVQWANISGEYKRDIKDFKQLCATHHKLFDLNRL